MRVRLSSRPTTALWQPSGASILRLRGSPELETSGFALLPLEHGGAHPLTKAVADPQGVAARIVGRSGFVSIQGQQARRSPWPTRRPSGAPGDVSHNDLPDELADLLCSPPGRPQTETRGAWDLAYFIALEDRRASSLGLVSLDDGKGSSARMHLRQMEWTGPAGPELTHRLLHLAHKWLDMGTPRAEDYKSLFIPMEKSDAGPDQGNDGRWTIDRIDYRQLLSLSRST